MAVQEAALLVVRHGWPFFILERDYAFLVHKLQANEIDFSTVHPLTQDIKCIVVRFSCVFSLVQRTGNKIACYLARTIGAFSVGSSNLPTHVLQTLVSDLEI
ncbi:UNVERIFIED_CONTAM: hypothetical protein Sradi_0149500 [Sesamum radiatum]|uniref:RNase H type-1 domain-containing protein n=1 Tax=Sesamum radiatum TaxID=300843 RepID=A0AAW2WQI3_SESRA